MSYVFIFTRDYNINDNISLYSIPSKYKVIPIFIFTPEQSDPKINKYYSNNSFQFLLNGLDYLKSKIPLVTYKGKTIDILEKLIKQKDLDIKGISINRDVTPFAKLREKQIHNFCKTNKLEFICKWNHFLTDFDSIKTQEGNFYKVFTPFYNKSKSEIDNNIYKRKYNWLKLKSNTELANFEQHSFFKISNDFIKTKKKLVKNFKYYKNTRDILELETTRLSPYLKYNIISIREIYNLVKTNEMLKRQLFWRDFYAYLMYHLPKTKTLGNSNMKGIKKQWKVNTKLVNVWKQGETGIPIIDAGMKELNTTGFMHNRARMITANFFALTQMNWRIGEKYFASKLVDYDPSSNNGNWQWINGVGSDNVGYLRIFNPFTQSEKYDTDCKYIKKWIPEFKDLEPNIIHKWDKEYINYNFRKPVINYHNLRKSI